MSGTRNREAGCSVECRYYKRVPSRAATTCWGLLGLLGATLPVSSEHARQAGQRVPAPATAPAPPPRTHDAAWTRELTDPPPQHLVLTDRAMIVSGAGVDLQALDLADGTSRWTTPLRASVAPSVHGARIIIATTDAIVAVQHETGQTTWTAPRRARVPPVAHGEAVFVAGPAEIARLQIADGHVLARADLDAPPVGGIAVTDAAVFVAFADQTLARFDLPALTPRWRTALDSAATGVWAGHDRVYVSLTIGGLATHAQDSGDFQWIGSAGVPVVGALVGADCVYLSLLDSSLRALDAEDGHQCWRETAPLRPITGPMASGGQLCAGLVDGGVGCWQIGSPKTSTTLAVPDTPAGTKPLNPRLLALAISPDGRFVARVLSNFDTQWWVTLARRVEAAPSRGGQALRPAGAPAAASSSATAIASRATPSSIRSGAGAENDRRR